MSVSALSLSFPVVLWRVTKVFLGVSGPLRMALWMKIRRKSSVPRTLSFSTAILKHVTVHLLWRAWCKGNARQQFPFSRTSRPMGKHGEFGETKQKTETPLPPPPKQNKEKSKPNQTNNNRKPQPKPRKQVCLHNRRGAFSLLGGMAGWWGFPGWDEVCLWLTFHLALTVPGWIA